jgi:hypothetical protein
VRYDPKMSAGAAVPVPSQLPDDAGEWVRSFASRVRDEVAVPLFAASGAAQFESELPELLARGAALRFRWLTGLVEMPEDRAAELSNEWTRSPPQSTLSDLQRQTTALLGPERSFQLQRAFALTFTDAFQGHAAVSERLQALAERSVLAAFGRLAEAAPPHDVLALAWMMVLYGDVPVPTPEVADAGATALLRLTAERLRAMAELVGAETTEADLALDQSRLPDLWFRQHPALISPVLVLLGLAFDDPETRGVELHGGSDPEEEGLDIVELRLRVDGDPDEALDRLEQRALRTGALGVLSDARGGLVALTSEAASRT